MSAPDLKSRVQLFIKCEDLKDVEIFSKSDPYVEIFEKQQKNWRFLQKTEVIWDNLNPAFATNLTIDYRFEVDTQLNFKIYDANLESGHEVQGDFLGESEYSLSQIVGNKGDWLRKPLTNQNGKRAKGFIFVRADQVSELGNHLVSIVFEGTSLVFKENCCQVFQPMFFLYRMMEVGGHQRVYASENLRGHNPRWKMVKKNVQELTGGDFNKPLMFELANYSKSGRNKVAGSFQFSLEEIQCEQKRSFRVLSSKGNKSIDIGEIKIVSAQFDMESTFLDYIYGGCSINLIIGVDFTSSNGDPNTKGTLHYIDPVAYNSYQNALYSVGSILLNYDTDKQVPVFVSVPWSEIKSSTVFL